MIFMSNASEREVITFVYPSSLPMGFLTHKTHTQTHKNPYPERGCGFLVGVGVGGPEIPQGYP
jgi:hypothetical protein